MRNKSILIVAVLAMFVFSLQIAEPAAAAKLKVMDHGSIKFKDHSNNATGTYKWTAYQSGINYVKVAGTYYYPYNLKLYMYVYLQKISKTKIKMSSKLIVKAPYYSYSKNMGTQYGYTKLSAVQYYWRVLRPDMLHPNQ